MPSIIKKLRIKKALQNNYGYLALINSSLAFSLMTVCIKKLEGRIPITELVFSRALISLIITRIMLYKEKVSPWGENITLLIIRGLVGSGALFCIFSAISKLPLATATVIQYTYPIFIVVIACILLKEKLHKNIIYALICGTCGIILVVQPKWLNEQTNHINYNFVYVALLGALLTAIAYICVRKLSQKEHPLVIIYYFPLISIPLSIPFILNNFVMPIGFEWILILGIGIFTQIGQISITKGLSLITASRASSINYVQVLFAYLWGIIIFSEPVNVYVALGGLLVLASTLLSIQTTN